MNRVKEHITSFLAFFSFRNNYMIVSLTGAVLVYFGFLRMRLMASPDFDELLPGVAAFSGVDAGVRLVAYYQSLLLALLAFVVCMLCAFFIWQKYGSLRHLLIPIRNVGLTGVGLVLMFLGNIQMLTTGALLLVLLMCFLLFHWLNRRFSLFGSSGISFLWLLLLSFSLAFAVRELVGEGEPSFWFGLPMLLVLLFLGLMLLSGGVLWWWSGLSVQRLIWTTVPLFFIPSFSFLSDEVYLVLNQRGVFLFSDDFWYLSLLLLMGLFVAGMSLFKPLWSPRKLLAYLLAPLVLVQLVLFVNYAPFVPQSTDMFELANPANGVMRLFVFDEWPIVQALSSHLLSEVFFKVFYVLLNGYNASIDFLVYDFLAKGLFVFIGYRFLLKIFNNVGFAFFFVCLFPFIPLVELEYASFAFVTVFLGYKLVQDFSFSRLLVLALWSLFLLVWKIEIGLSSLLAVFFTLSMYNQIYSKSSLFGLLKIIGGIVFLLVLLFLLFYYVGGIDVFANFMKAKSYFGATQAHAYAYITSDIFDRYYVYHYYLFPILSLGMLGYLLLRLWRGEVGKQYAFTVFSLIFLLIYYFVHAQKGLVRHGLVEGTDTGISSFFFLNTSLFIYYFFATSRYVKILFVGSFLLLVHNFKYEGMKGFSAHLEDCFEKFEHLSDLEVMSQKQSRVLQDTVFEKTYYGNFKAFMDQNFDPKASFIDFSNSPMLYFYTQRRVPSYFNQYMQNTVTPFLQEKNLDYLQGLDVPVVVFSHSPENWFDRTDGVPNTIRYATICRYIYQHYRPYALVNGYCLWLHTSIDSTRGNYPLLTDAQIRKPKSDNLKMYPSFLSVSEELMQDTSLVQKTNAEPLCFTGLDKLDKFAHYIGLVLNNPMGQSGYARLEYLVDGELFGSFDFVVDDEDDSAYVFPVYTQYNWVSMDKDTDTVYLKCRTDLEGVGIKQASLFNGI